jgi:glyoxylase-like metal-dependent hydrolase (beta-lactamase superfamily II)
MNPRLVASYDQPELRLIRDLGRGARPTASRDPAGRVRVPTGGHSAGHQGVIVRGRERTVAFFGDLCMRPWSANPKWVTAFDDFPLDSVAVKAWLFARAADEGWTIVLSHEPVHPVGRLVRDRDRFSFEALV